MEQDDAEIVERVLAGDRGAFGTLIDRHRGAVTRLAFRILRVRADAEDVAQEAFLHAFLELAEIAVERVVITALRDNIFYASLVLRIGARPHEVDARPSDAIAFALTRRAPIFVTPEMLALPFVIGLATALPEIEEQFERKRIEQNREPEVPGMKWMSFRSLPRPDPPRTAQPAGAPGTRPPESEGR